MSQIKPMVDMFEDYENNKESIQEQVNSYIDETSEAEAVWVADLDGNKIPQVQYLLKRKDYIIL